MITFFKRRKLIILFSVVYLIVLLILVRSVVLSGFYYRLNADELYHSNVVYLMLKGLRPYADFYSTYSPFLHMFLMPAFLAFGSTLKAINISRILMIALFIVQVFLLFLLTKKVFGKKVALIFVPLFLFDPFMVFVGMQIRPENLMMIFYILFLLVFSYAYSNSKATKLFFLSGILFAITLLTNLKILPSLFAFALVFAFYVIKKRLYRQLLLFVDGFCITFLLFFAYFLIKGYLAEMFLGLFIDPVTLNNSIPYPTWLGYFYFQNPVIYGIEGKSINWIYAWTLPVLAFAGGYAAVGEKKEYHLMKMILFASLILQWVSMLFINSVFIQYYIPLNWLYSLFAAYFVYHLVSSMKDSAFLRGGLVFFLLLAFFLLYKTSLEANISRSRMRDDPIVNEMNEFWRIVPEGSPAFPDIPFRPPIYPVLWGSTFAKYIRDRYPPVYKVLDKYRLKMLVGLNDEYFSFLDEETQQYILSHYVRDQGDNRIWRLKSE